MASNVDELTIEYVENGITTLKVTDKVLLTKGAWATVLFQYQDWDRRKEVYGSHKYSIRRYQKRDGEYKQKSKFTISSDDQAKKLIHALQQWLDQNQANGES